MHKYAYLKGNKKNYEEFLSNYWLSLGDTSQIQTANSIGNHELWKDNPNLALMDLMRQPDNFGYTCKILFNLTLHPFQVLALKLLWKYPFVAFIASRGGGKSFLFAVYCLLKCLFCPGTKIILTGASFRQAKIIFSNAETIWKNAEMLQDILSYDKSNKPTHDTDMYQFRIFDSSIVAIPTGDGSRIRGQRCTCLLADEFNSQDVNIYQEIMQGFGAVSSNPMDKIIEQGKLRAMLELGDITQEIYDDKVLKAPSNQQIIGGTCGYTFQPLYKYWKKFHDIIMSKGDKSKLEQIFERQIPEGFDWRDYAIIRLPYNILPKGYMDDKIVGQAKATTHVGIFDSEYGAVFQSDSMGFFRRTLIEQCVCRNTNPPVSKPSCGIVEFCATLRGEKDVKHVMGIDPAAEQDNFAIIIIAVHPDHRRIKYCWTVNKETHKAKLKYGLTKEHDYYRFCARKIRDLKRAFNIEWIAMDAQGGGLAISETLGDPNSLEPGEAPIYPIIEEDIDKTTDNLPGEHILHMIQFSKAQWVYDANHGLRKDMETCELMFPLKDSLAFGLAREEDKIFKRIKISDDDPDAENLCDTLENCLLEIEELKNELVLIEHSKTDSGRDKWDTPQVKGVGSKKGRLRKDRYSALLMANMIGRSFIARLMKEEYQDWGNSAQELVKSKQGKNEWDIGFGITRYNPKKRF